MAELPDEPIDLTPKVRNNATLQNLIDDLRETVERLPFLADIPLMMEHSDHFDHVGGLAIVVIEAEATKQQGVCIQFTPRGNKKDRAEPEILH